MKTMNTDDNFNNTSNRTELPIPPGIPQSIIIRVIETCGVNYEIKKDELFDKEYPVLYGDKDNIENAKSYLILFTEAKLALRDIARLARRFKKEVKVYTNDEDLKHAIELVLNDITNKDKIEILNEKLDSEDFETINICGKTLYVFV
ncbi:hypothetical protein [Methanothermococcus okinawensis]|uniref:Uncharacterized protein n=1 Tax=Methanothermococcus okinawensis (strain DSM 14208 / JCM 11175 / IH1) TaxID=647113 RepID=F8AMB7_METOI|nr:hypothetical protein [Methanothermococcus okinawensis]AEH06807.1 hypothetical protein Metok_0830 [Methanothermococcus okinawensis IH1]